MNFSVISHLPSLLFCYKWRVVEKPGHLPACRSPLHLLAHSNHLLVPGCVGRGGTDKTRSTKGGVSSPDWYISPRMGIRKAGRQNAATSASPPPPAQLVSACVSSALDVCACVVLVCLWYVSATCRCWLSCICQCVQGTTVHTKGFLVLACSAVSYCIFLLQAYTPMVYTHAHLPACLFLWIPAFSWRERVYRNLARVSL